MTNNHKRQLCQVVYLSSYMGASMTHIIKLLFTLPFQPTKTAAILHTYEGLLDGQIGFIRGASI